MKQQQLKLLWNPFEKIAGVEALLWGLLGIAISTVVSWFSHTHYHGLMSFGPNSNNDFMVFAMEHVVVWLVPAILFLLGGLIFSKSRIRIVDVFGTVAFAQLPFVLMSLFSLLPPMQHINNMALDLPPMELISQPGFITAVWFAMFSVIFLIWTLIWMFQALKVSCNLKGVKLGVIYAVAILGGDVLCRIIISALR